LAVSAFTIVITELLVREQRARAELAAANERLRGYAAQAEQLATTQERNRLARDIHDGLGHHLTVVQMLLQAARAVTLHRCGIRTAHDRTVQFERPNVRVAELAFTVSLSPWTSG
jgi:signal transduction histidine kinase